MFSRNTDTPQDVAAVEEVTIDPRAITMDDAVRRIDGGGDLTSEERFYLMWLHSPARTELDDRLAELDRRRNPERYLSPDERRRRDEAQQQANQNAAAAIRAQAEAKRNGGPNIIRERKQPEMEDRGFATVLVGDMESFLVPPQERAGYDPAAVKR